MSIKQINILILRMFLDKKLIFSRLKSAYCLKSDATLSRFLGIAPTTLASWKKRNTFDFDIIYSKCEEISWNYLIQGLGEPFLKNESPQNNTNKTKDSENQLLNRLSLVNKQILTLAEEVERIKNQLDHKESK